MFRGNVSARLMLALSAFALCAALPGRAQQVDADAPAYLKLGAPQHVLAEAQAWEGNEFPHTMSVLKFNHDGFKYWGWYGLNEGRGIGLARSNDLVHWTKYAENPLWKNARWPSALEKADPKDPGLLYYSITRDYDTPSSYVVLATSRDGIHLKEEKVLIKPVPNQRNQNSSLFHDPQSGRFYLTYYRGNDKDQFEIVSRSADSVVDLDKAPEKVLLRTTETVAAPTLLFLKTKAAPNGIYFMATEIFPHRYSNNPEGEWQVRVFAASAPDGDYKPVAGNPIMRGQRACLFQHVFDNRFYGYDCHQVSDDKWELEEVEAPLP